MHYTDYVHISYRDIKWYFPECYRWIYQIHLFISNFISYQALIYDLFYHWFYHWFKRFKQIPDRKFLIRTFVYFVYLNTKVVFATGLSAKDETSETTVQILYRHFYQINLFIMGMGGAIAAMLPTPHCTLPL